MIPSARIIAGDCIEGMRTLADSSVHCCVTSPPYWGLRDYGHDGQIGLEETPEAYVARMVEVFREVRRVLRDDGTLWLNLGDSYRNGKQLAGIPWMVAFALQSDGWCLRQDIIWHKPNPMPESVRDRCTKAHEYVFLMTKSERYFYDADAISEPSVTNDPRRPYGSPGANALDPRGSQGKGQSRKRGEFGGKTTKLPGREAFRCFTETRNRRSVWRITTKAYKGSHFATMPPDLARVCIMAGTSDVGCCVQCQSPAERVTSRTKLKRKRANAYTKRVGAAGTGNSCANDVAGVSVETVGWSAGCECHDLVAAPCTVLDPFAGSGTTLAVSLELGRSSVGCELNPEYVALAERRISKSAESAPLFSGGLK